MSTQSCASAPQKPLLENNIAVLWGGWSDEREVSHASSTACAKALVEAGFARVDLLDVAQDNFACTLANGGYDVAFIGMHGAYGEDGCIQGLCEILHIPYTGSHVLASAMAADKNVSKTIFARAGLPVAKSVTVWEGEPVDTDALVAELGLPLFVKPAVNGSSYGVSKVYEKEQLLAAIALALESDDHALVESCVEGTEITVPVVGNKAPRALPIVEIVTGADFYDLTVKYEPTELHHVIPARLDEQTYEKACELAVRAHKALGCSGVSRSDFIVTEAGVPVILETNTIPGMTESSLLPDSAAHAGISFGELVKELVELALEQEA